MSWISKIFNKWTVLISTILFWGLAFSAIKYSVRYLTPVELAGLRFMVADAFFLISILVSGFRINRRDYPVVFILGLFGVAIYHVCLNIGEIYITSGVASLLIATAPIFVLILSWIFLKERITVGKIAGIMTAFSGVAVLSKPEFGGELIGVMFVLISSVSAAVYTVLGKKLMKKYDYATLTNFAMILGSLPLMVAVPSGIERVLAVGDLILVGSFVFLGVFSTYLGYLGWYYFLEKEEASRASVFLLAIPLVAVIAGVVLLGENVDILTIIGGMAIVGGIATVLKK